MNDQTKPGTLLIRTQRLLAADTRTLPEIYRDSGLPFYWLKKFAQGNIKDPSVNRVQSLYEFLSGRKLSV